MESLLFVTILEVCFEVCVLFLLFWTALLDFDLCLADYEI